jgi:hypothetical protein
MEIEKSSLMEKTAKNTIYNPDKVILKYKI